MRPVTLPLKARLEAPSGWSSRQIEAVSVCLQRGNGVCDQVIERHSQLFSAPDDVLAVYGPGERFVFHFLFHGAHIDILNVFCGTNQCDGYDKAA